MEKLSIMTHMRLFSIGFDMAYSEEQLRRKAHLESGGTIGNYDRSHYTKNSITIEKEVENDTSKTNNN
jgi:hypothetical protein